MKNTIECADCGRSFFIRNHIKLCLFCRPKFDIDKIVSDDKIKEFNEGSEKFRSKYLKTK